MIYILIIFVSSLMAYTRDVVSNMIFFTFFSFFATIAYVLLNAPDVAITEAAIGVAMSTIVIVYTLKRTGIKITKHPKSTHKVYKIKMLESIVFIFLFVILFCIFNDVFNVTNNHDALVHSNISAYYIKNTFHGVPNIVTGILASYRGFDTLLETAVVFLATIGILLHVKE